jgi:hypothetical protein
MNQLFTNPITGNIGIQFDDDNDDDDNNDMVLYRMYEPSQLSSFISPITNMSEWIQQRKQQWCQKYNVYNIAVDPKQLKPITKRRRIETIQDISSMEMSDRTIPIDFWSHQGYDSYQHWLRVRKVKWHKQYSWNQQKRHLLEQDLLYNTTHTNKIELLPITYNTNDSCTGQLNTTTTAIPNTIWDEWIRIRKNQWKVLRRKRQRRVLLLSATKVTTTTMDQVEDLITPTKSTPLLREIIKTIRIHHRTQ